MISHRLPQLRAVSLLNVFFFWVDLVVVFRLVYLHSALYLSYLLLFFYLMHKIISVMCLFCFVFRDWSTSREIWLNKWHYFSLLHFCICFSMQRWFLNLEQFEWDWNTVIRTDRSFLRFEIGMRNYWMWNKPSPAEIDLQHKSLFVTISVFFFIILLYAHNWGLRRQKSHWLSPKIKKRQGETKLYLLKIIGYGSCLLLTLADNSWLVSV